jgi:peroxiredoxin
MRRFITIIFLLVCICTNLKANDPVTTDTLSVGDMLPPLTFTILDGKTITTDDLKGKTTLLVFFATWCGPCRAELPHVQKEIWEQFKDNPNFVLLAVGREHTPEELVKFSKENKFTFPIVADIGRKIYSHFALQLIPRTYLIDKKGKIIKSVIGFNENEFSETEKYLKSALKN